MDLSPLQNWPDPGALQSAAQTIAEVGNSLRSDAEQAGETWQALRALYDAPDAATLHAALIPAIDAAAETERAAEEICVALEDFASMVRSLEGRRHQLLNEASALAALPIPPEVATVADGLTLDMLNQQKAQLQSEIDQLGKQLSSAAHHCAGAIAAADDVDHGKHRAPADKRPPQQPDTGGQRGPIGGAPLPPGKDPIPTDGAPGTPDKDPYQPGKLPPSEPHKDEPSGDVPTGPHKDEPSGDVPTGPHKDGPIPSTKMGGLASTVEQKAGAAAGAISAKAGAAAGAAATAAGVTAHKANRIREAAAERARRAIEAARGR